jgi:hypothetical protein
MLSYRPTSYLAGERATGLNPLSQITVLEKLVMQVASRPLRPSMTGELPSLDISLLNSSPPDGTELRQANHFVQCSGSGGYRPLFPSKVLCETHDPRA